MRYLQFLLLAALLAGCSAPTATPSGGAAGAVTPVLAVSELTVGSNRLALGLIRGGSPINDPKATVQLRFYDLSDTSATPQQEQRATYYGQHLPAAVYVAYPSFAKPGEWAVDVVTQLAGEAPQTAKLRLDVLERSQVPNVGERAIAVKTLTAADVADLTRLSSVRPKDDSLYRISLDAALASGRPTVLLFATPAFCRTAVCGPSLDVLAALQKQYGAKANFIHVEVYRYPFSDSFAKQQQVFDTLTRENRAPTAEERAAGLSDPMAAWGLLSEPWMYLIDGSGVIAARYEGGITEEELGPAVGKLVGG